eukprot:scaffold2192_cov268-Chaetoceros_neogracile.AAC.87
MSLRVALRHAFTQPLALLQKNHRNCKQGQKSQRAAIHGSKKKCSNHKPTTSFASSPAFIPIAWYARKLETHPLTTKCITSGIISGMGDMSCQYIYHKHDEDTFSPDWLRTGRFSLLGFGLIAPVVHKWYGLLMKKIPGQNIQAVLKRLFCDQILFAPLFIPTFMTSLMALEGKGMDTIPAICSGAVASPLFKLYRLGMECVFELENAREPMRKLQYPQ